MTDGPTPGSEVSRALAAYLADTAACIAFFSRIDTGAIADGLHALVRRVRPEPTPRGRMARDEDPSDATGKTAVETGADDAVLDDVHGHGHGLDHGHRPLDRSVRALPVASLAIALPAIATLLAGALVGLPAGLTAVLAVAAGILATGALHEDGLADVADGFWGGHDRARRLEIMRDSRIGTYGVLALFVSFSVRVTAIAALLAGPGVLTAAAALAGAAVAGRTALLLPWVGLAPARRDGLAVHVGAPTLGTFRIAVWTALALALALAIPLGLFATIAGIGLAAASANVLARLAERKVGGHTGDVLGATEQVGEIAFLTGALIFLA